jgi:hypothetical protein
MNTKDDYMSDTFVVQEPIKQTKKPEPKPHDPQKLHSNMSSQQVKKVMMERAKEALNRNILKEADEEEDKGLKMLMKMGFKQGQGLGKSNQGIQEPININPELERIATYSNRKGIKEAPKPKEVKIVKQPVVSAPLTTDDYRERMKQRYFVGREKRKRAESDDEKEEDDDEISSSDEEQDDEFGFGKFMSTVQKKEKQKKKKKKTDQEFDISYALDFEDF